MTEKLFTGTLNKNQNKTKLVSVLYEILTVLKNEWSKCLHDSCVDNSKAACTYPNDQNYCFSLHIILIKALFVKMCVSKCRMCAISKITNSCNIILPNSPQIQDPAIMCIVSIK